MKSRSSIMLAIGLCAAFMLVQLGEGHAQSLGSSSGSGSGSASNSKSDDKDADRPNLRGAANKIRAMANEDDCVERSELDRLFRQDQNLYSPELSSMQYDDGFVAYVRDAENNTITIQICHQ